MRVDIQVDFRLDEAVEHIVKDLSQGTFTAAELVMADSKTYYVPVDTGNLRNSGFVEAPEVTLDGVEVRLGFGGAAVEYAAAVHEMPPSWGQGKNKYLSQALYDNADNVARVIANTMKKNMAARSGKGA